MKSKSIFKTAALLCMAALSVNQAGAQDGVLPRHEFTINGFGGLSTLDYSISGADVKKGLAGGGGLGYNFFFNDHWGLGTGVEAAYYTAKVTADKMESGEYWSQGTADNYLEQYIMRFQIGKFKERQHVWMIQVPLMLQWLTPINSNKTNHFYIAAGGRVGFSFSGKYKQSAQSLSYAAYDDGAYLGRYSPEEKVLGAYSENKSLKFAKVNAIVSGEIGFRWKIGNGVALYTGAYIDYGLRNIAPKRSNTALLTANIPGHPAEFQGEYTVNSILRAHRPDYAEAPQTRAVAIDNVTYHQNSSRYTDDVKTFAAGLKLKLAFGKPKKVVPIAEPIVRTVYIHDTIVKKVPVVVHDTVRVVKEVPQEIKEAMMRLSNVLFAFDKFNLSPKAVVELNKVTNWLNANPDISVEISGHTDSMGSDAYNQRLSENRAKSVCNYFEDHGVSSSRLSYKGYGESQPIADNATAAGRQMNRRVELKITK